jgi:hypothetical protein
LVACSASGSPSDLRLDKVTYLPHLSPPLHPFMNAMASKAHHLPGPRFRLRYGCGFSGSHRYFLALLLILAPLVQQASAQRGEEYQVKAVFLFNFSQFVKWPARAFPDAGSPLVIGVLGDDPFGGALQSATRGETANGRKVIVKNSRRIEELRNCQFVFISKSENGRLNEVINALQGSNVLTVGEADQFCNLGGVINFTIQGGVVSFEINVGAAKRAGLEVSPKLVKLGKIHRGG